MVKEPRSTVVPLRTREDLKHRRASGATHGDCLLNQEIPFGPQPGVVRLVQGCHIRTHVLLSEDHSILSSPLLLHAEDDPRSAGFRVSLVPRLPMTTRDESADPSVL